MATSRPSTPSNLVQVHTYRHLAPAYAAAPSQGSGVPPSAPTAASSSSSSSSPSSSSLNSAAVRPFTPLEVQRLVLEYLAHEGYVDSAIAFASEMVTDVDADADSSAASGEEEEEEEDQSSPARTGANSLAAGAGGSELATATEGDAMQEDVGATTDDGAAAAAAETHSGQADSPVINGNSKNVVFLEDEDGEEQVASTKGVVAVKPSALSEDEVQDLRLRKSESAAAHAHGANLRARSKPVPAWKQRSEMPS